MAREAGFMLIAESVEGQSDWWECFDEEIEKLVALVRADEREKAKHNEEVLMNALWKACGDDGKTVVETIESQGELK
jgi:hypothetical protein